MANINHRQGSSRFFFNSGKISSTKSWLYGRFEVRAQLPEGKLLRSVFVLKPKQPSRYEGDWLDNGQINGLVYAQQTSSIIAGIHYRMPGGQSYNGRKLNTLQNITTGFHRYSVEWTNHTVRWLFNDMIFFETTVHRPFDQPFYFVLQLGVGGPEFDTRYSVIQSSDVYGWRNNRFVIDYVRVYRAADGEVSKTDKPDATEAVAGVKSGSNDRQNSLDLLLPFVTLASVVLFIYL